MPIPGMILRMILGNWVGTVLGSKPFMDLAHCLLEGVFWWLRDSFYSLIYRWFLVQGSVSLFAFCREKNLSYVLRLTGINPGSRLDVTASTARSTTGLLQFRKLGEEIMQTAKIFKRLELQFFIKGQGLIY